MRAVLAISLAVAVTAPATIRADPAPRRDATGLSTDDCARARKAGKTCVLDVAPEEVDGSRPAAGGFRLTTIRFEPTGSLIRLRHDFIPEIVKAAEDL